MTKTILYNQNIIPIEVIEEPAGHLSALVRSIDGFPFDMSHGYGLSIANPSDRSIRWHDTKWINKSEIIEEATHETQ